MWGQRGRRRRLASFVAIAVTAALATAGTAGAATTSSFFVSQTTPFTLATSNPCTGEPVTVTGTYHFESNYSVTIDTDSASFHSQELKKYSLSGLGASGARYQNEQQQMDEENGTFTFVPPAFAPDERTETAVLLLLRQGEITGVSDDFYLTFVAHITYTANGAPTATIATLNVTCR
jgi:hypothetical protein